MTVFFDLDELLLLAADALDGPVQVRDHGLLESALARPRASVSGQDAYPDLHVRAAAMLHSLVSNPALVDGNERLGWHAVATFLDLTGHPVLTDQDSVVDLVVAVAAGQQTDLEEMADRLRSWTRSGPCPSPPDGPPPARVG